MKHLLRYTLPLCLALLGCECPVFGFLPCSVPAKVTEATSSPNTKGCWRVTAEEDHGVTLDEPGDVSCESGEACIILVPGQTFWYVGAGKGSAKVEDVDCSEVCP